MKIYEFDLYENEPVGGTQFHTNGLARRLVLTWHSGKRQLRYDLLQVLVSNVVCGAVGEAR